MNLTITANTIADPGTFGTWGLLGQAGALSTDNGTVCADITGNSLTGSGSAANGGTDFELDQVGATTFKLPGYSGGSSDTNAVVAFVQGQQQQRRHPDRLRIRQRQRRRVHRRRELPRTFLTDAGTAPGSLGMPAPC
jgi:hypothetical protein